MGEIDDIDVHYYRCIKICLCLCVVYPLYYHHLLALTSSLLYVSSLHSWGNIVAELKRPPLALIRAKYFGRKSLGELAGSLETPSFARGLEDVREEAGMALTTLLDFSFSNRVIYFNEMDRAAVEALAAQSAPPVDLEEPKEALRDAKLLTKELAAMI